MIKFILNREIIMYNVRRDYRRIIKKFQWVYDSRIIDINQLINQSLVYSWYLKLQKLW